ncbi:U2 snRNP component prp10 [Candida viswanathii]|uniref:U2 snRNP component prp10 n=1 Tax=Candida viswanathii TaxID=5486 RepID=A0A367YAQ6_9ASCO|nr:U2 snRNP component prp10 [Candida viswanathii]
MTPPQDKKKSLAGNYSIPDSLNAELQKEFTKDVSSPMDKLKDDILNQNSYNRLRFQRAVDLNLDEKKSYKQIMNERNLEREEFRVEKLIKEKQQQEPSPLGESRRRKQRWDVTPEEYNKQKEQKLVSRSSSKLVEELARNKLPVVNGIPLTDEILDKILPPGYTKVRQPPNFQQNDDTIPPDVIESTTSEYYVPPSNESIGVIASGELPAEISGVKGLDFFKEEDMKHFGKLAKLHGKQDLSDDEQKEIGAMKLILKVKNGSPIVRKRAMKKLTSSAIKFGPKILLNQILPVLMEPNLDPQERHLLVRVVGRVIYQLNDSIRPYTHQVLSVISPFLIDEDPTIRLETREIISSLTKAAGLANIISTLRPDLDHVDEYVRNLTARIFAIVANTLGLKSFLPFLKAVVKSKKNWTARHTGIKIIQQLCIMLGEGNGSTILPYLSTLVEILIPPINDEATQVRTITALTLGQLAENVSPYGIESFEPVLEPIWFGIRKQRGKGLASFLKCIGSIIPLMSHDVNYEEYTNYYTTEVTSIIVREFESRDEDMRKTILNIIPRLPLSRKLIPTYESKVIKPFLKAFWNRRTATDSSRISRLVVEATNHLAIRFDFLDMLDHIVYFTKDNNEELRRLAIDAINKLISSNEDELIGMDSQLDRKLVDGVLYAFQNQSMQNKIYLTCFGTLASALNVRLKPHLNSILSTILYRMKNKLEYVRQQASDLITIMAPYIKQCSEDDDELLTKLILILYESLGEVYPEVLGSIITALYACLDSIAKVTLYTMSNPSINQILPTLTPILKNRHEKVQEACINLVGLIARKNAETINAREWMRICFDLLEMLKAQRKRIRVAANRTFGYIAQTIGPQDVIVMLLSNLRVQERQLRVCTAVAMGIVAETCLPFTVLPAIMNEYRTPEKNVQNGVLKAMSFMFEYLDGKITKDYLFAITPLLEDALTDRDLVHRQTAATVVFHIALNCIGFTNSDYTDVFVHFLNLIMPNIFETSPHVIARILESIDGLRLVIGNGIFTNYLWSGLFHPARKVRTPYWKIYNSAYVECNDALVPYYPRIEELPAGDEDVEQDLRYKLEELDLYL